jgi:hypothetical protein
MARLCQEYAIIETCVAHGNDLHVEYVDEIRGDYTQSSTGRGCRPTRAWVFAELQRCFPYAYVTRAQPAHPEFPTDWDDLSGAPALVRAVFVGSQQALDLPSLSMSLLQRQERWAAPTRP